jgi:hypothetical protein
MSFTVYYGNVSIECQTLEAAEQLARNLHATDTGEFLPGNKIPAFGPWTAIKLDQFLERLGPDQKTILRILVEQTRANAEDLRTAVNVDSNKSLAGVLSGISKQAAAMGIDAREVFGIENRRRSGVLSKSFLVADNFQRVARSADWPHPPK